MKVKATIRIGVGGWQECVHKMLDLPFVPFEGMFFDIDDVSFTAKRVWYDYAENLLHIDHYENSSADWTHEENVELAADFCRYGWTRGC